MGGVLASINSQDAEDTTKTRAKRTVMNILKCVQIIGDVVASASGSAFPASQKCFNAINGVIGAVKKYHEIFEDLTIHLEYVSVFLGNLRIYYEEKNIDAKLDEWL
ncbi:unnamed protein product [Alternaria alternata]